MTSSSDNTWTVRRMLAWIAQDFGALGIATGRLDAEILVSTALALGRVQLYLDLDRPLDSAELAQIKALVVRRRRREPVAYITGNREFYRRSFEVSKAVLIPRPDTETLIERALELLPQDAEPVILDLCTGSGAIAVTLAAERPNSRVTATDLSEAALEQARRNAERHGVGDRIEFALGDLYAALASEARFDLIAANPPYIADGDLAQLQPEIRDHEPQLALASGPDGLSHLRRLAAGALAHLKPGGSVLFEVGAGQAGEVEGMLLQAGLRDARSRNDLGGIARIVEARA
jgi:release factor glutamine methyltransferase